MVWILYCMDGFLLDGDSEVVVAHMLVEGKHLMRPTRGFARCACGKGVVLPFGFVLSRRSPLWMYLFGAAKDHNRPSAISKIAKWVPISLCS